MSMSFRTYLFTWYQSVRVENPLLPTNASLRQNLTFAKNRQEEEEKWIEAWQARFLQKSLTGATMNLGHTRCTNTCWGTTTRDM